MVPSDPAGELHDSDLEREIELLAEVIDAVAAAGHPLCQSEVDQVLGLVGKPVGAPLRSSTGDSAVPTAI